MEQQESQVNKIALGVPHPNEECNCRVCGKPLYSTDHSNFEITFHCSSPEARFWDFDRGTIEQNISKKHWDESKEEVYLNKNLS